MRLSQRHVSGLVIRHIWPFFLHEKVFDLLPVVPLSLLITTDGTLENPKWNPFPAVVALYCGPKRLACRCTILPLNPENQTLKDLPAILLQLSFHKPGADCLLLHSSTS